MLFDPLPEVGDGFGSECGDGVPGVSPKYVPVRMLMAWITLGRRHGSTHLFLSHQREKRRSADAIHARRHRDCHVRTNADVRIGQQRYQQRLRSTMAGVVERDADVAGLTPYLHRRIGDESRNDRGDCANQPDSAWLGAVLCGRSFEPLLLVHPRVGRKEDAAPFGAGQPASRFRVEAVE
jgi:hypothetical protein